MVTGQVSLLSIVSVSITLRLEAAYDGGSGELSGTGTLRASVKICWCFTISVQVQVHMKFGRIGGSGGFSASSRPRHSISPH